MSEPNATATQTATDTQGTGDGDDADWARLLVVSPPALRQEIPIPREGTACGRKSSQGVFAVPHQTVSREHLQLQREAPAVYSVADLGSRNGTWQNAEPVGRLPRVLTHGDVLRFGDVVAVFECGTGSLREPPEVDQGVVLGRSAAAVRLRQAIARAAQDAAPVLVLGQSGTGKEAVAAELHRLSGRKGPLVVANCAALSASLVDSQLFGHERGAFTGAVQSQEGFFRAGHGGTLFLDEFGELPLEVQPKLLRVVENGEVIPVGRTSATVVDTRVVAATHRDLEHDVETGRFRRDLFARLSLLRVTVPPLQARRADILAWLELFVSRWRKRQTLDALPLEVTPRAVEALLLSAWPENLRGLDRVAHRHGRDVGREKLRPELVEEVIGVREPSMLAPPPCEGGGIVRPQGPVVSPKRPKPDADALREALAESDWNVRAVARVFDRDRRQIYRWMEAYGIERPEVG
ncbi:MAG: sigma 54-interacting transcriptional regulator [Nannocystales bacterium]